MCLKRRSHFRQPCFRHGARENRDSPQNLLQNAFRRRNVSRSHIQVRSAFEHPRARRFAVASSRLLRLGLHSQSRVAKRLLPQGREPAKAVSMHCKALGHAANGHGKAIAAASSQPPAQGPAVENPLPLRACPRRWPIVQTPAAFGLHGRNAFAFLGAGFQPAVWYGNRTRDSQILGLVL
jgi:hypothetical protein